MSEISIDTVKVSFPVSEEESSIIQREFNCNYHSGFLHDNGRDWILRFRYCLTSNFGVPSYSGNVFINCSFGKCFIECSLPKLIYGHSVFHCWNFDYVLSELRYYIMGKVQFDILDVLDWRLYRVDPCYNFFIPGGQDMVNSILSFLSKKRLRGKAGRPWRGKETSPCWIQARKSVKFYNKFEEILTNKKHYFFKDEKHRDIITHYSQNCLRYEEKWLGKYLCDLMGVKAEGCTVGAFIDYIRSGYDYKVHIDNILDLHRDSLINKIDDIYSLCSSCFGRKFASYIKFMNLYMVSDRDYLLSVYPKTSFFRFKLAFKKVGIDLDLLSSFLHQEDTFKISDLNYLKYISSTNLLKDEVI